jgi:hypothetical protein
MHENKRKHPNSDYQRFYAVFQVILDGEDERPLCKMKYHLQNKAKAHHHEHRHSRTKCQNADCC